jgi:DNA polymerase III epsilon subunit-like protein
MYTLEDEKRRLLVSSNRDKSAWVTALPVQQSSLLSGMNLENDLIVSDYGKEIAPSLFETDASELLAKSFRIRGDIEHLLNVMRITFMRHMELESYDLPRLIGIRARELNDEIDYLKAHGAVAHDPDDDRTPFVKTEGYVPPVWTDWELDASKMNAMHTVATDIAWSQGRSIEDVLLSLERRMDSGDDRRAAFSKEIVASPYVSHVVGIDLETTGLSPLRNWIIDAGWESIDLNGHEPTYDTERHQYGVPSKRTGLGNPSENITGINVHDLDGLSPLDADHEAQDRILHALTSVPFVAHNAKFEDSFFMQFITGYAEARRSGIIRIIDTKKLSQRIDPTRGNEGNSLEVYAKRWGALGADESERHLGLEDTHIMLIAMRNHLQDIGVGFINEKD